MLNDKQPKATWWGMRSDMAAFQGQIGGTHYADKTIQPWQAMESWMTPEQFIGFLRGNALKYLARCDDKGGIEDIKKARHYLDALIDFQERLTKADLISGQRESGSSVNA